MALRPAFISLKCPRPETTSELAAESAVPDDDRIRRPVLAREEPERRPPPLDTDDATSSPIPAAVTNAYRVFDRYLDEGKSYAQGESAWFPRSPAPATALAPTDRGTIDGLVQIADQLARMSAVLQAVLPESCPIRKALQAYDARGAATSPKRPAEQDGRPSWTNWFADRSTIHAPESRWPVDDVVGRS